MSNLKIVAPIHYFYDHPRYRLPDEIKLESNLRLTRFDKTLVKLITDYFQELYSGHDIKDLENCRYCVVYDFQPSEKESKEEAQKKIHHVIESLRIVRPTRAACSTFLFSIDNSGNLTPEGASQRSSTIFLTYGQPVGSSHFEAKDTRKIKRYYKQTHSLYEKFSGSYSRVLNAFIFFQLGYLTHYAKLRIVPFTTSLESLFNTSEQEIGYSLRIRSSAFLGNNQKQKESLVKKIKVIYELRSAAVHGSSLPKRILKNPLESNSIIRDAEEICRLCLQRIFDGDLIDVFSQPNDKLSQYLDELVLS